jgi:hypothetical protein
MFNFAFGFVVATVVSAFVPKVSEYVVYVYEKIVALVKPKAE